MNFERIENLLSNILKQRCLAKVNTPITKKRKIGPKTIYYAFVGYFFNSTTFIFLVSNYENF